MASPPSQQIALWVVDSLDETDWVLLSGACLRALTGKLHGWHENDLIDLVEEHLAHIAEHLRDRAARSRVDGEVLAFEIDDEPAPYVRGLNPENRQLLAKLRSMHPDDFEKICARILQAMGAEAERTGQTHDGGVDFLGYNFAAVPNGLPMPLVSKAIVVGQAKRYKATNRVNESEIRKFVGGALKKADELRSRSDYGVLSPVIFAFWTTSEFDLNARNYARAMGIWTINGSTMTAYVKELGLESEVLTMDAPHK